ncbi:MAG: ATP-binding protein [Oscillospiraceae bacterium]|nr:ATP-binding protein [Oscillospiraceae bacterium]
MKELTLEAKVERLDEVLAFIDGELEAAGCPMKTMMQIDIAAEELFVNVANYAYAPGVGMVTVRVSVRENERTAAVSFLDSGVPFDPLKKEDPDVSLPAEEREIGGLGIFMAKKTMDELRYEYAEGQNRLTMIKKL